MVVSCSPLVLPGTVRLYCPAQVLVSDTADPLTTQGNSTTLSAVGGLVQMTGFKQVTPDTSEANALAGSSDSNTAIDFVFSTLDNWAS